MLAQDTNSFIAFFNDIKDQTLKANREYETLKTKKSDLTKSLRTINDNYTIEVSGINKNLETLQVQFGYKQFLDDLAPDQIKEEIKHKKEYWRQIAHEENMRNELRSQGVVKQKTKLQQKAESSEGDVIIPPKLKDLIDEPDVEYDMYFTAPDQLLEFFAILEEKNLFLIQQGQEAEHVLETKQHDYEHLLKESQKEINILKESKKEIKERIKKNENEKNQLQNTTLESENKVLDPVIYSKIDQ